MAQQAAVTGQPYVNNGGTVKKATAASGPITKVRTLLNDARTTSYGSKVALSSGAAASSGNLGTFSSMTTFAYKQVAGRYIMKKNTGYVNGVANTLLTSCATSSSERMRSIPFLESTRVLGSGVNTTWNYETGAITKDVNAGQSVSFGIDNEARPSNAVPGELAYKTGAKLPVADEYKPKTAP
jgi:hypothetical protein